jgi:hypothetical protein
MGYVCARCGELHPELPFAFHAPAPATWTSDLEHDPDSELDDELCVVRGEHFFVRGILELPVHDADQTFHWGVWVSLSAENFQRTIDLWETEGRETEPPYFGWLTSELPIYDPSTLSLRTHVHTQPVGTRPRIELEPTDHPLAIEQRQGISISRVEEIAGMLHHQE